MPQPTSTSTSRPSTSPSPRAASAAPLLAYFPLDVDVADHSGNGNDATGENLAPAAGVVGGAMHFDGATSTLHVPSSSATLQGPRTLCAWVRPNPTSGLAQPVFWAGVEGDGDFFSISASAPSGGTCPSLPPDVPFVDHWGTSCFDAPTPLVAPGAWSFLCYAYDGAELLFQVQGAALASTGVLYDYGLDTLWIGSTNAVGTTTVHAFDGDVDEVTVWSSALAPSDMSKLWNGGAGCAVK